MQDKCKLQDHPCEIYADILGGKAKQRRLVHLF